MSDSIAELEALRRRLNGLVEYLRRDRMNRNSVLAPQDAEDIGATGAGMDLLGDDLPDIESNPNQKPTTPADEQVLGLPQDERRDRADLFSESGLFTIIVAVTSGTSANTGNSTTQCGFHYDVTLARTGKSLGTDQNPIAGNHKYTRPNLGARTAATFGIAEYNSDGDLRIIWINEADSGEACA